VKRRLGSPLSKGNLWLLPALAGVGLAGTAGGCRDLANEPTLGATAGTVTAGSAGTQAAEPFGGAGSQVLTGGTASIAGGSGANGEEEADSTQAGVGGTPRNGAGGKTAQGTSGAIADGTSGATQSGSGGMGGDADEGTTGTETAGAGSAAVRDAELPSCAELPKNCGTHASDDCCASDLVPGGRFTMGRDSSPVWVERPQHEVSISSFKLDRYEVTVGRFRNFTRAYDDWELPLDGAGARASHPERGWRSAWNGLLPANAKALVARVDCVNASDAAPVKGTWNDAQSGQTFAVSCVDWYMAFAFCIWDGGRLPTEAEWEYAAAGGDEQRTYPWGESSPQLVAANYANYGRVLLVGTAGAGTGKGRFGQFDLIGNVWEWMRDDFDEYFYSSIFATEPDPLRIGAGREPVVRGASFVNTPTSTTTAFGRYWAGRIDLNSSVGVRCARD
jgi:formylglycine-generating enzyme